MDAQGNRDHLLDFFDDGLNLVRKGSPIGIAEDDPIGVGILRSFQCGEGILGIVFKSVEEMLRIKNDF